MDSEINFTINAANAKEKESFFKEVSTVLFFPDYWHQNLDSLDELLNDLDWIDKSIIKIDVINSSDLLINEPEDYKKKVLQLFDSVVQEWQNFENDDYRERKKVIISFKK